MTKEVISTSIPPFGYPMRIPKEPEYNLKSAENSMWTPGNTGYRTPTQFLQALLVIQAHFTSNKKKLQRYFHQKNWVTPIFFPRSEFKVQSWDSVLQYGNRQRTNPVWNGWTFDSLMMQVRGAVYFFVLFFRLGDQTESFLVTVTQWNWLLTVTLDAHWTHPLSFYSWPQFPLFFFFCLGAENPSSFPFLFTCKTTYNICLHPQVNQL